MKARTIRECILLYRLSDDTAKGAKIGQLLKEQGIKAIYLTEQSLPQKIGYLTGIAGYEKGPEEDTAVVQDELMAFYGFSNSRLNQFLQAYRQKGIEPVALKAMVTEHNRDWRLVDLFGELKREHALFQKLERLQQLIGQGIAMQDRPPELEHCLSEGRTLLQSGEPDDVKLGVLINKLEEYLK